MLRSLLLVGFGGAAGSMLRYGIGSFLSRYVTNPFPIGTFSINVVGSLIIGILFGLVARNQWLQEGGMLLLASGFCGGFTTFSTFALENVTLMQKGQSLMAILYTGLSVIIGLLLCRVGIWLAS
jgi:CrcB protein